MTYPATNGLLCERTRGWLSLALDRELSDFERALMDAHLRCCAGCREFEREVGAVTAAVRTAPLVPLETPVSLPPQRRRPVRTVQVVAAAAAVLVAAGVGSILGSVRGSAEEQTSQAAVVAAAAPASDPLLRDLRVAWLKPRPDLGSSKPPLRSV